jgi:hypothetical protein
LAASLAAAAAASKPLTPAQLKAKQKLDAKDTKRREVREEAGFFFVKDGPVEDLAPKHTVKSKATHRGRAARDEISPATCFDKCFPPGLFQLASTETTQYGRALCSAVFTPYPFWVHTFFLTPHARHSRCCRVHDRC